jgi:hypothetical protein
MEDSVSHKINEVAHCIFGIRDDNVEIILDVKKIVTY